MKNPRAECRKVRDRLLRSLLDGGNEGSLPAADRDHFRDCPACSRYREGIGARGDLFPPEPLLTPGLRRRTLERVARRLEERPSWLAPVLLPASAASVALTLILPLWLLSALLRPLVGSEWLSLGFALALYGSVGLLASGLGIAALAHRRNERPAFAPNSISFREVPRG